MKNATDADELKENKGSGFGLMNCKGIIEKYKKTDVYKRQMSMLLRTMSGSKLQ